MFFFFPCISVRSPYPVKPYTAIRALSGSNSSSSFSRDQTPAPAGPSSDDTRAAAAVLLHKLLLTEADSSSSWVVLTAATAHALAAGSLDVRALTRDEAAVAAASAPAALGLAAVVDCCATPLGRAADAIAALSCEAARCAPSDAPANSAKDEADVAADLKKLLTGSSNLCRSRGRRLRVRQGARRARALPRGRASPPHEGAGRA